MAWGNCQWLIVNCQSHCELIQMKLQINEGNASPAYRQLYEQLRRMILDGEMGGGERLPASRALAQQLAVARVTVTQAYERLAAEGFVHSRVGAGTFVTESLDLADPGGDGRPYQPALSPWGLRLGELAAELESHADYPDADRSSLLDLRAGRHLEIDFGFGRAFTQLFPYDIWRRLLARYLSTDDTMLSRYGSAAGFEPLRQAIADYLVRARGVRCTGEQVVIVSGAQQALDILSRLLLAPDSEVLVETPGYSDAFDLFRLHNARLVGLAVGDQGAKVEQIPRRCRARLAFVTPGHQFPRGGTLSLARRLALLQWARTNRATVIEDDYDGDLRYDGRSLAALQGVDEDGRVVYLGTFSKVLFPALRLGYLVLPPTLLKPFVNAKGMIDRGAPTLMQAAVADFITEGHFERHLRRLRKTYGRRRATLVAALERYLPGRVHYSPVAAGLHVMLYLKQDCDEVQVVRQAAAEGVGVYPGAPYHLERPAPPSILLGFSGLNAGEIEEGIRRLGQVIS
jgi:GntR family transcriptional regulator/MocR family aminotransferase